MMKEEDMLKLLHEAGALLYGPRWQSSFGRALKVSDRSVRRWLAEEHGLPEDLGPKLRRLIDTRISELKQMRRRLPD
jgi:hypothetical protein